MTLLTLQVMAVIRNGNLVVGFIINFTGSFPTVDFALRLQQHWSRFLNNTVRNRIQGNCKQLLSTLHFSTT